MQYKVIRVMAKRKACLTLQLEMEKIIHLKVAYNLVSSLNGEFGVLGIFLRYNGCVSVTIAM